MDPDLQDFPEEIGRFLAEIQKDYDLVFGIRRGKARQLAESRHVGNFLGDAEPFHRTASADRSGCDADFQSGVCGSFPGVPGAESIHRRHLHAHREMGLAFDAILDYSEVPLRMAIRLGLLLSLASLLAIAGIIILRLLQVDFPAGWSMISALTFAFGVQLFFIGIPRACPFSVRSAAAPDWRAGKAPRAERRYGFRALTAAYLAGFRVGTMGVQWSLRPNGPG
jgi:dolichol-phosphate mannosyltransferase